MRLYSAAFSSRETFCRSGPSAATRRVWVPVASSVSLADGSAEEPSPDFVAPDSMLLSRPPRSGRPRSVLIFTVPDSCWTSDLAILSRSCCAVTLGRFGSPESASAGTSPMVAAATPTTVTGTMYRAALRRPDRRSSTSPASVLSSVSYGAMSALPPSSAAAGPSCTRPMVVPP